MLLPDECLLCAEGDLSVVEAKDCHCDNCGKFLWGEHTSHCNSCHSSTSVTDGNVSV